MDQVLISQVLEGLEDLDSETANEAQGYALEVVVLDELVKVDAEELE